MSHSPVAALAQEQYISLTTFKRDGTPVATPVWVAGDAGTLLVITEADSGKAKRLRNSGEVRVAACDMRGNVRGDSFDGTAVLLDALGSDQVSSAINKKYGLQAKLFAGLGFAQDFIRRVLRKPAGSGRVGIRITLNT